MSDHQRDEGEEQARQILERLGEQLATRQRLAEETPARGRKRTDQKERLRENQETLLSIVEEAITNPVLVKAIAQAGFEPADLKAAATRGAWDDDVATALRLLEREAPSEWAESDRERRSNRVSAADELESAGALRQVAAFGEAAPDASAKVGSEREGASVFARLRGLVGRTGADLNAGGKPDPTDPFDDLPEALKRRYAVHVSDDRKTIQLFENGASSPAITLDAKSISTTHNAGAVVADVIALARDRGWQALKVAGTAEFKDSVWIEAGKLGLSVEHDASPAARAALAKWDRERPDNQVLQGGTGAASAPSHRQGAEIAAAFMQKSAEERLADPRLRNAQLELMVGIRTAEKELQRPIAEMPEVAKALTAAIREQLVQGRVFDAPFVKPSQPRASTRHVTNPRIEADRIPPPRP